MSLIIFFYNYITFFYKSEQEYEDPLQELTKKWFLNQSKHHVSASAANNFWDIAFKFIPLVLQSREKKVPKCIQQRRKLKKDNCPPVTVEHCYRNKINGEILHHSGSAAPVKTYQDNSKFEKLYEIAYVKVNI